jgi:sulfite reductase (NADPH) hemoprotein beta-component
MYQYTDFDRQFVQARRPVPRPAGALAGRQLSDDEFRPLRLQNGWYVQRYAPMLRVAVPYGELSSRPAARAGRIARDYDRPMPDDNPGPNPAWDPLASLPSGYAHFTTRQNVQYNWIPLDKSADVMDLLASVDMHGIQTSGNCIRNITSDERAGIAVDEIADPRPFAKSCASGARCTPSSPSCRASSRSPSPVRCRRPRRHLLARRGPACQRTTPASWASGCWWAAAWAARRSSPP